MENKIVWLTGHSGAGKTTIREKTVELEASCRCRSYVKRKGVHLPGCPLHPAAIRKEKDRDARDG